VLAASFLAFLACTSARGGAPVLDVSEERFAADLRTRLVGWYHLHAADVGDGEPLDAALDAVDPARVVRVVDPVDDPFGHDLDTTAVFLHPDVVWPGSDRVWVGSYALDGGELIAIEDFE
jgi:hypothetical protein